MTDNTIKTNAAQPKTDLPPPPRSTTPPPVTTSPPLPPLPTTAPSSDNNIRAATPGWQFQPGSPGSDAQASAIVDNRVIDASKIYNGGRSLEFLSKPGIHNNFASNTVEGPPSIVELARALKNDPQLIFEYVYNNIDWQACWGVQKGALGALMDGSGNSFDQSMLLVALLRQAGFTANYVKGQISLTVAQYDAWFGTDSSAHNTCYWYAQYANIPGTDATWNGTAWVMTMSHVWVEVVVSGTTYTLDPSYKTYTRKSPVAGLGTILGYNAATFLSDVETGATIDPSGNFVQNMNTAKLNADLTTMTSNLVTYIKNNAVGAAPAGTATVDDVLGGAAIVPITLPFTWNTSLPYELAGDTPTRWTGDVPLTYKTTLQVQYPHTVSGWAIDQTFTSDQLAGGRLTVTFDGTLHPVLTLNGTVIQTGAEAQGAGTWNSIQLTVTHNAFASLVYPHQWWQSFIYAGQYYLIGNAWGNAGRGQADFHQKQLVAAIASTTATDEQTIGETLSHIWFNLVAQASKVADFVGRLNSTHADFFHQVGMVSYTNDGTVASAATDIAGVSGFTSTLNYDFTQLARTNTVVAMHGVALEAASLAQFTGVPPGTATTTVIDKANRTAVVTIGGTKTTGNTLTITVNDTALSGGTKSKTYTVLAGDTLTTIAAGLAALINGDTSLAAIGVTATSSGTVILISTTSANQTSYTSSTSGGATETITIAWSKIYLATSANWTAGINISATLSANGYSAGDISGIGGYISTGVDSVLLGDRPNYTLGTWTGEGDWVFPNYTHNGGALGLIEGSFKGGNSQQCFGYIDAHGNKVFNCQSTPSMTFGGNGQGVTSPNPGNNPNDLFGTVPPGPISKKFFLIGNGAGGASRGFGNGMPHGGAVLFGSAGQSTSAEPIGLVTGDYFYDHTDITIGSQDFPYSLSFGRSYSSANQYQTGPLGWGWTHNHAITATIGSDGLLALGEQFAVPAAASIAELYVSMDLAADSTQPITKMITMSLADKWWIDQLVNNTVVLSLAGANYMFVKQPDGSYTAPAGLPSTLTLSGGLYTLTTPQGIKYNFNSSGQISTWVSPAGMTVTYTYSSGLLSTISNGFGRTLTLHYTSGQLTSVTDGTGRSVSYAFDVSGNLSTFTDAASNSRTYSYVTPGRMTSFFLPANPSSPIVTNTYDTLGRVKVQSDAYSNAWNYYFAGSRSEEVNPNGFSKVNYYNQFGSTLRETNEVGQTWTTTYDGLNRPVTSTAPEGNSLTVVYNSINLATQVTAAPKPGSGLSNIVTHFTYDATWNKVKTSVDGLSQTTTYNYDATTGNLLNIQPPMVGGVTPQTSFTYNSRGQALTVTDPTGIVTQMNYDTSTEKLTSVVVDYGTGRLNLTATLGYDSVGNCNSVQDPRGNTATATFDNERRLTQTVAPSPFSYVVDFTYDVNGNMIQAQRQTGSPANPWQTTTTSYAISGDVASVTDPVGKVTGVTYDAMRRLWTATDSAGRVVTNTYDNANRLYQITDPSSTVSQTNSYTNNGLLASVKDANSNTTQYSYDGFDRPDKTTYPDSSYEENTTYDANANVLTVRLRSANTITFTYDVLNRVSTKAPTGQATVTMGYDLADRVVSVSVPVVVGDPSTGTFQKFYDTAGRFYKEQYPDTKTFVHVLDAKGNPTQTTYPDGYFVTRVFDQLDRLTDIKLNGAMTSALNFQYDQLSRRTLLTYENGTTTSYGFGLDNSLSGLSQSFVGSSVSFSNGFDNVHQMTGIGVTDPAYTWRPASAGTITYASASNTNQYPTVGGATYSYNSNGCLSGDGTWTYGFNTENMLTSASKTGVSASYSYDPQTRQILKNVGGTKTQFYYAGMQRMADYDGSGTLLNRYVYGPGLDEALIQVSAGGTKTYYHQNQQGSVVATSNSSGVVVNKYTYSPFGESTSVTGLMPGFTGQRYDSETGLYYYKARYYSPSLGRFLQPDPLGYGDGLNMYAYVQNSPLNFVDPMGTYTAIARGTIAIFTPILLGQNIGQYSLEMAALSLALSGAFNAWLMGQSFINIPSDSTGQGIYGRELAAKFLGQWSTIVARERGVSTYSPFTNLGAAYSIADLITRDKQSGQYGIVEVKTSRDHFPGLNDLTFPQWNTLKTVAFLDGISYAPALDLLLGQAWYYVVAIKFTPTDSQSAKPAPVKTSG